eukprot:914322_1
MTAPRNLAKQLKPKGLTQKECTFAAHDEVFDSSQPLHSDSGKVRNVLEVANTTHQHSNTETQQAFLDTHMRECRTPEIDQQMMTFTPSPSPPPMQEKTKKKKKKKKTKNKKKKMKKKKKKKKKTKKESAVESAVECDICNIMVSSNSNLKRHKMTHTGAKPFECKICNKKVSRKDNLLQHITNKHLDPYQGRINDGADPC